MRLLKSENIISPNEVNQSIVRSVNTLIILIYITNYAHNITGSVITKYTIIAFIYLVVTIPLYLWSLRCVKLSDISKERHVFRVFAISGDIIILSIVIALSDTGGVPLLFMYLWIIVANGIRYGIFYLIYAVILSITCFSTLILETPAWQAEELFPIALGLLTSLVVLPLYILNLISRLSIALQAEKKANRIKNDFLAVMNHEIRTPLSSIINLTDLISAFNLPNKIHGMLEMIKSSASTQLQIVNGMLDISRVEAGQYAFLKKEIDLYGLIHEVQNITLPIAQKKGIGFYVHIDPRVKRTVVGSYDQLKQILVNIIGNAVKFTDMGFVKIFVHAGELNLSRQELIFEVHDTGIGIDKKDLTEIFKPFRQADANITKMYGGTGLGIAISDELARLMGGKISVESTLKVGSIFTFRITLGIARNINEECFASTRLLPINLGDDNLKILDEIEDVGVDVLRDIVIDEVSINKLILDDRVIVLLDEDGYEALPEFIKNILLANDVPIIMILKKTSRAPSFKNVLTSITSDTKGEVLENALNICREFMPKNKNSFIVDKSHQNCNYRILLAEDDYILREVQKIIFQNAGFELKIAKDGHEALLLLNQDDYDLVILDLYMPSVSGLEVAVKFKEDFPDVNTKFILLTADINKEVLANGSQKLFNSILIKPTTATDLLNEVYKILDPESHVINKLVFKVREGGSNTNNIINQKDKFPECYLNCAMIDENVANIGVNAIKNILKMYDKEVVSQLIEIESEFEKGCYIKVKDIFHTLRGTSSSMGTIIFAGLVEYMLLNINDVNKFNSIKMLMKELMRVHNLSIIALNIYINSNDLVIS